MMIMSMTYQKLHSLFCTAYSSIKISCSAFYKLRPWNLRHTKRESCLCGVCENYAGYCDGLQNASKIIDAYVDNLHCKRSVDDHHPVMIAPVFQTLQAAGGNLHKQYHMEQLLCHLDDQTSACVSGERKKCGIKKLWSQAQRDEIEQEIFIALSKKGNERN